jgi:hypothetical protein
MKPTALGPDHGGRESPIKTHPGMVVSHNSHADSAGQAARGGNIARDAGRGKVIRETPVHGGMTSRQMALKGMQHGNSTEPDANPSSPLSKIPEGKAHVGQSVPAAFGMRNRDGTSHETNCALGKAILDAAYSCGSPDDRMSRGSKS